MFSDGLMSYTSPQGSHFDENHIDFRDRIYDRIDVDNELNLSNGLGLLADGTIASVAPTLNESAIENRNWIGWNSAQISSKYFLFITFCKMFYGFFSL